MATRGGYVHISMGELHPDNISFMQFSTKIDGFEQKDSQGFENSYNSYEQYPLEKLGTFTIYQNYTLALMFRTSFSRGEINMLTILIKHSKAARNQFVSFQSLIVFVNKYFVRSFSISNCWFSTLNLAPFQN